MAWVNPMGVAQPWRMMFPLRTEFATDVIALSNTAHLAWYSKHHVDGMQHAPGPLRITTDELLHFPTHLLVTVTGMLCSPDTE